ncbi:hypothetical protein Isop_1900 [Isosphaera pallida ATCC 43644]|uniref:VanZ family protein n=1 Tax=Isosphaera pallida (strain ATCC 43644 / DSM 9630 / IS1B) TaxID=575540 RepID=E8R2I0_ISOPI|nr:hypothetical protein [Isosphaera pallida]ADV62480.1 hypothetical protein Isop_1900 [Isosphaera pallida ATCC 43644]
MSKTGHTGWRVVAVAWTLVIMAVCWWPENRLPKPSQGRAWWILSLPHHDKLIHAGMFLGFGLAWSMALRRNDAAARLGILGGALALAALTEAAQPVFERDADWLDGLCDLLGAGLGVWAAAWWRPIPAVSTTIPTHSRSAKCPSSAPTSAS